MPIVRSRPWALLPMKVLAGWALPILGAGVAGVFLALDWDSGNPEHVLLLLLTACMVGMGVMSWRLIGRDRKLARAAIDLRDSESRYRDLVGDL
jgi:hypothetical protein